MKKDTTILSASQNGHRASCEVDGKDFAALIRGFCEIAKDLGYTPEEVTKRLATLKAGAQRNTGPKLQS